MLIGDCVHKKIEEIQMKITIKNVAKVYEASLRIKGITVVAGLNNTGKSTILKSIYSGLNVFRNIDEKIVFERKRSVETVFRRMENYFDENGYSSLPQEVLTDLASLVNDRYDLFVKEPNNFELFYELFIEYISIHNNLIETIKNNTIYSEKFVRPIFEKIEEVFSRTKEHYMKYIGDIYLWNAFSGQLNNEQNKLTAQIRIETDTEEKNIMINNNSIESVSGNAGNEPNAIYIPAFNMLDVINGGRINRGRYSAENDIRQYLSEKDNMKQSYEEYQEISDNTNLIREILEEVIHGKLEKTSVGEFRFKDDETGGSISMANIASGLKNFLIIQSLVENGRLKRNSILLIDEPETNLHPEWHLIFAEILVLMYKYMGVMSIVNSHSPYFIRALEVKLVDHGLKDKGTYYLMREQEKNMFRTVDVSDNTSAIYDLLYKPLEYL